MMQLEPVSNHQAPFHRIELSNPSKITLDEANSRFNQASMQYTIRQYEYDTTPFDKNDPFYAKYRPPKREKARPAEELNTSRTHAKLDDIK